MSLKGYPLNLRICLSKVAVDFERSDRPSARVQYVQVNDLPIKLKEGRSVYGLNVDENFVLYKTIFCRQESFNVIHGGGWKFK